MGDPTIQNPILTTEWYMKAAGQGHANAQLRLGNMYRDGYGVEKNLNEAARWWSKSAAQGNKVAHAQLQAIYESEELAPCQQDAGKAVAWRIVQAYGGNTAAQFQLGAMYYVGQGVPEDHAEAMEWFRQSAAHGHAGAQKILALPDAVHSASVAESGELVNDKFGRRARMAILICSWSIALAIFVCWNFSVCSYF